MKKMSRPRIAGNYSHVPTAYHCGYANRGIVVSVGFDAAVIECCKRYQYPSIVDLGCGAGELGVDLLAQVPLAKITAVDREDRLCSAAQQLCKSGRMRQIVKPVQELTLHDLPGKIHFVIARKFFHWLRYPDTKKLLNMVVSRMVDGAGMYYCVATLAGREAWGYKSDGTTSLAMRYIPPNCGLDFSHSMTLYTEREADALALNWGMDIEKGVTTKKWGMRHVLASLSR